MRVAVIGTYRSGSSLIARILHELGVDMGSPFHAEFFEPQDLSVMLRQWWKEPSLIESESAATRTRLLSEWVEAREKKAAFVGAKHPLLTLSADDLLVAWGKQTKFIWSKRSLEQATQSLVRLGWWEDPWHIQRALYDAAESFMAKRGGFIVDFDELLSNGDAVVKRLAAYVQIEPTQEGCERAVSIINPSKVISHQPQLSKDSSAGRPYLVATMLCGADQQALASAAIQSARKHIDRLLFIDTGAPLKYPTDLLGQATCKVEYRHVEWQNDFSEARNKALEIATEIGARWVMTLDSDERMDFGSIQSREALVRALDSQPEVVSWMVSARDGAYAKERFIRLPSKLMWRGRTHEALCGAQPDARKLLSGVSFWEEPKSREGFAQKLKRDLKSLRDDLKHDPENGRLWYYLGQTLADSGQYEGAIFAFDRCAALRQWDELAAWACFRSARCMSHLGFFDAAIERCALALAIDAKSPEAAWLAAWCHYQVAAHGQAITWAKVSIELGCTHGRTGLVERVGFRDIVACYEAPFDVLRFAYKAVGKPELAADSQHAYESAIAERLDLYPNSKCPDAEGSGGFEVR